MPKPPQAALTPGEPITRQQLHQASFSRYAFSNVANLSVTTSAWCVARRFFSGLPLQCVAYLSVLAPSSNPLWSEAVPHPLCLKVPLALLVSSRLLLCSVRLITKLQFTILKHSYIRAGSLKAYWPTSPHVSRGRAASLTMRC